MKPVSLLLTSVLLSSGVAAATVLALAPDEPAPSEAVRAAEPAAPAADAVADLREELARQGELLETLAAKLDTRPPQAAPTRAPAEDVEAVVRRVLDERAAEGGGGAPHGEALAADGAPAEAAPAPRPEAMRAELAALLSGGSAFEGVETWWAKKRAQGVPSADLVAAVERFAAERPNDPAAQVMLGDAYIQRLQEAKNGPEMGQWAMRADGAYDDALALDESNWEARFSKAVSLSFWPPIFGKQGEAIAQFEMLLEQQGAQPVSPEHAETYVFLGNLYQQQGDVEKAKAVWQQGYAAFPDHSELASKASGSN